MSKTKNIKINDQIYKMKLQAISKEKTYSGTVYPLQVEENLMAIKIYRTKKDFPSEQQDDWFPPLEDIQEFIEVSYQSFPFLLSNCIVLDEENKYIGCGTYCVTETKGDTKQIIFDLPRDKFFQDTDKLREQIPVLSKAKISLSDCSIDNIKFGTITKKPKEERLYIFDDSNYRIEEDYDIKTITKENDKCFNELALDILYFYLHTNQIPLDICYEILDEVRKHNDHFSFLEKESRGYLNMNEFLLDYTKRYQK